MSLPLCTLDHDTCNFSLNTIVNPFSENSKIIEHFHEQCGLVLPHIAVAENIDELVWTIPRSYIASTCEPFDSTYGTAYIYHDDCFKLLSQKLKCPKCASKITADLSIRKITCEYCGVTGILTIKFQD